MGLIYRGLGEVLPVPTKNAAGPAPEFWHILSRHGHRQNRRGRRQRGG